MIINDSNNMLSVLDSLTARNTDHIGTVIAADNRRRRIEKNMTREQVAEKAGISVSNVVRFEQKGLISLNNLMA